MPPNPVDPRPTFKFVVLGRVVTMDGADTVIPAGAVYVANGLIERVCRASDPPPAGYETAPRLDTNGSIYPGLIDLHNHLSYNALRLWDVPKQYENRDQWAGTAEYHQLISGPMGVLGRTPSLVPSIVRYVECKALVGGVTTSQGIRLASAPGIAQFYPGIVRNVEHTGEQDLPGAMTRISDVAAAHITEFSAELGRSHTLFLHLSEGTNGARKHFTDLKMPDGTWAISPKLVGIHCVGLKAPDIKTFAQKGGAMIWSPLSNLLLYGKTALVEEFKSAHVRMGLGCDWSPSGSKNILGEMKVARVYSRANGSIFTDKEIVAMATRNAAGILGWQAGLGSIEEGKRADLVATDKAGGDAYSALIESTERNITLVAIEGVPRFGLPAFIRHFVTPGEQLTVGGRKRLLNLKQDTQSPLVARVSLAQAKKAVARALKDIPHLAAAPREALAAPADGRPSLTLALDETEDTDETFRLAVSPPEPVPAELVERIPLPFKSLRLDPLTVVDDSDFLDRLANEPNLPDYLVPGLRALY
jgi:5-methylthioadenosine/S-adenosylhomocysteine deaminase